MKSGVPLPPGNLMHDFEQPDGFTTYLHLKGDYWFHYYETPDHCVAYYNPETKEWKYAIPHATGELEETEFLVGDAVPQHYLEFFNTEKEQWVALKTAQIMAQREEDMFGETGPQYSPAGGEDTTSFFNPVEEDSGPQYSSPSTGTIKVLVLLANFSDTTPLYTPAQISSMLNDVGYSSSGSVRDYLLENSYGQLTVQFDVYGWYNLPQTRAFYGSNTGGNDKNVRQMVIDAVALAEGIDFSQYDLQGYGLVSSCLIIHAGRGEELGGGTDAIWSHYWNFVSPLTTPDGVTKLYAYSTVPELQDNTNITKIGVICHELGHLLFDFVDTYDGNGGSYGLGNWCCMAYGGWLGSNGGKPCHYSSWLKKAAGWIQPTVIRSNTTGVTLAACDQSTDCVLIPIDPYEANEYFLIANRYKRTTTPSSTGYDQYVPGSGAIVYHVDETIATNNTEARPRVRVVEADGLWHMRNTSNQGDAGDVYVAGQTLGPSSTPNTNNHDGVATGITVSNFSGNGTASMQMDIITNINLLGKTISYDVYGMRALAVGYNGVDFGLLHATMPEGGTITGICTLQAYSGTINFTASIYSGFDGANVSNKIGGPYTTSGSGRAARFFTVNPSIHLDTGTDFYVEIKYDSGYMYPLVIPYVPTPNPTGRGYTSSDGVNYQTLISKLSNAVTAEINIRVRYIPDADPGGGEREILTKLTTNVAGRLRRKRVLDGNVIRRYRPGEGTGREIIGVVRD